MARTKQRIQRLIWALQVAGLRNRVEILPDMHTLRELLQTYVIQFEVEHLSPTLSLFRSKTDDQEIKTQLTADGEITCSCKPHLKDSTFACIHIGEFCIHRGIDIPGGWFAMAQRLDPSFIAGPIGDVKEVTRRNKAYRTMPQRVREMAYILCRNIPNPPVWPKHGRERVSNRGAKPVPLRVLLYCLLVKVAFSQTYYSVREEDVNRDSFIQKLGGKRGVPNWNLLCETLGDPDIRPHLEAMLERTARIGRLLDFALLIDGSGFGTTLLRNWRGSKYGGKVQRKKTPVKMQHDGDQDEDDKPSKVLRNIFDLSIDDKALLKKFRGYIKVHTAAGAVSGLIYAIAPSLNFGAGAGDSIHFQWLVEKARRLARFEAVIADKAYESARHFAFAAARNLLLFVLPRKGDTLSKAEPDAKHMFDSMNLLREKYPEVYRRFYRLRSKIEAFFSAMKRTNAHIRTKIRNGDVDRMFGLRHDPYKLADSAPEWMHAARAEVCRMVAVARVGDAHANEAYLKGIAMNLRTLCRLEAKYGTFDLEMDEPIRAVPRVSLPRSA